MSEAPERMRVAKCHPFKEPDDFYVCHPRLEHPASIEYLRKDHVEALLKAERERALREALSKLGPLIEPDERSIAMRRINALIEKDANDG